MTSRAPWLGVQQVLGDESFTASGSGSISVRMTHVQPMTKHWGSTRVQNPHEGAWRCDP